MRVKQDELRPREKLAAYGPGYLSSLELLQVMLGSGSPSGSVEDIARRVLPRMEEWSSSNQEGYDALLEMLLGLRGVGAAKAAMLAASLELASRLRERDGMVVRSAGDVMPLLNGLGDKKQEHFVCVTLNGANRLIARRVVTIGLADQALVHPREVFAQALVERAAKVIVAHNHPAGDLRPSGEDVQVTEKLAKAAAILGLELLDHLIVCRTGYFSFREEGLL
jgi:DNA repair protein RadC